MLYNDFCLLVFFEVREVIIVEMIEYFEELGYLLNFVFEKDFRDDDLFIIIEEEVLRL